MNSMKTFLSFFCFLISVAGGHAQSYHFSQFFSTPLLTNPANTGFTEGPFRFATNFRSQGMSGGAPFLTGYFSADASPLRSHLPEGHKAGIGLYVMNDRAMNGVLQTNAIGLSTAYHVGLDPYGEHSIGLGVQGAYHLRRIDYSRLTFENQYGPGGYDPSAPVGEALDGQSRHFFDLNTGIMYNASLENKSFFAGMAVYNLLRHRENAAGNEYTMPLRLTFQSGAQFWVGEKGKVYFSLTAMSQAKAAEVTFGSAYGYQLTDGTKNELMAGLWYRNGDAVILYLGYQTNSFQAGLSYDYTVSGLKSASQLKNGYELTLVYKAPDNRELKMLIPWY
jgi:type IX secretion system PorP/SprF family membrane protein